MDFQQIYQLYDYYYRMFSYYDYKWMTVDSEEFYLAIKFLTLKNYFERALNNF